MPKGIPGKSIIVCSECGQEKLLKGNGLCERCYNRLYMRQYTTPPIICTECGKKKPQHGNGMCRTCYLRAWREANPNYSSHYHKERREKDRANEQAYYQKYPERVLAKNARRKARKAKVANTLTKKQMDFEMNIARSMWPDEEVHLHHIVPISKGGGHTWGNIVFIPASLNFSIGDKLPQEVYQQLELI